MQRRQAESSERRIEALSDLLGAQKSIPRLQRAPFVTAAAALVPGTGPTGVHFERIRWHSALGGMQKTLHRYEYHHRQDFKRYAGGCRSSGGCSRVSFLL